MKTYKKFVPTQFDPKGYILTDRQDWLVSTVSINRDSSVLQQANWKAVENILADNYIEEGESTFEIHRFNHWANGWFEIILINPNNKGLIKIFEEIESNLSDYPILSESIYSEMRVETINTNWTVMSLQERVFLCEKYGICFLKARHDYVPDNDGDLDDYLEGD